MLAVARRSSESGLDIPTSNTIIINRADRFGLAQLYQLRGRVGRGAQQAYAYLLIPPDGRLDETATRRLRAIEEVTDLGAGFHLAMRDLEIRGAGNLLGPRQHGHITAVGFDLYTKLLAEAVRELKGEPVPARVDPVISAEVEALLPETYVPEVNQRLALYQRVAELVDVEEIAQVRGADRPLRPPPHRRRGAPGRGRTARGCPRRGRGEDRRARGRATLTFAPSTSVTPEHILKIIAQSRGRMTLRKEYTLEARIPEGPWPAVRDALTRLLESLA